MNTKDLMIGDWYYWEAEGKMYPYQVTAEDFVKGEISNFQPIPLTSEILEKNGFEKSQGEKFTWFICNVAAFDIRILNEKNNIYDIKIAEYPRPIKYVHEFQHALKLCKIEKEIVI